MNDHGFDRVGKDRPCPICEREDWCLIARDGSVALCQRVQEGSVARINSTGGWLHRLKETRDWKSRPRRIMLTPKALSPGRSDLAELAESYRMAVRPSALANLARDLGVTVDSLQRLRVGWFEEKKSWSFPMVDGQGMVNGIRLRSPMGRKFAVQGGREGLFVPIDGPGQGPLVITEGPTDLAALLTLGFSGIGRPNCGGGVAILAEMLKRYPPGSILILSDNDPGGAGQNGAHALALKLRRDHRHVRIVTPPGHLKDARQWVRAGATRDDVLLAIAGASPIGVSYQYRPAGGMHVR